MPISVMMMLAVLVISFASSFWVPKKLVFIESLFIYFLLAASIALLILNTGGTTSPYLVIWALICISASIFGLWGFMPILIATGVFSASIYLDQNSLSNESIIAILISGILPLIASVIVWHSKSARDEIDDDNKAYKKLATELNAVASKSEVVINAIGDGVIAVDNKGVIQLINPAAQRIIGWGKQDAVGLNYKSVLRLVDDKNAILDPTKDPIQQVLNNNQQIRTNDLGIMTNSDKKIIASLVVSPIGDTGSGVIAVFHDITKEKAEERQQAEFISTASHEMRTPVAAIEGYLSLALNTQTAQVDDRARDFINKAHASVDHLGHLFQDLLDVSKADDGRMSNNPKVVDIVAMTNEIIQSFYQKAASKGVRLVFKPVVGSNREKHISPVYFVNLDNDHIREIVNNLTENAIKYTQAGEIIVDITGDDDHVTFSIKDSGIGIPIEDVPHLFQKFYRVDNKDTREIGGTGLGLYICRRLAEIMGGRIWVESARGRGSTFYVELPRISSQEASKLQKQEVIKDKQEADKIFANQSQAGQDIIKTRAYVANSENAPIQTPQPMSAPKPVMPAPVPRSSSLTPEQIAAYVAKQRALAQQQALFQNQPAKLPQLQQSRIIPQPIPVPKQPQVQPQPIVQPQIKTQVYKYPAQAQVPTPQPIAQKPQTPQPAVPQFVFRQQPQNIIAKPQRVSNRPSVIPINQIEITTRVARPNTSTTPRPITMSVPGRGGK